MKTQIKIGLMAAATVVGACGKRPVKRVAEEDKKIALLTDHIAELETQVSQDNPVVAEEQQKQIEVLREKLEFKRDNRGLSAANARVMQDAMAGHTTIYPLAGDYRVMVIPVEFADKKFANPDFYRSGKGSEEAPAQDYLFGDHANSMTTYYRHESQGRLNVTGQVTPIVTVDGNLVDYGEAITGSNDKNARGLVVQALRKLTEVQTNRDWWMSFDRWDLQDYDSDRHYYEADGFIDAVVLIYAGKDQASCQRSFDPEGRKPASAEVPPGPRHDATVECFNRIWPHRWSISIQKDDPLYSANGPTVEGYERPSFNGLKINEELFALDYNMQSEFSDRSTFFHEFGHSLSLPDVYANAGQNSTGAWELMSNNANLQGQELSAFSRMSLGWLRPKITKQGQVTSAYLGSSNFVTSEQRDTLASFEGPLLVTEPFLNEMHEYDVVSTVPDTGEAVYRSVMTITEPTAEPVDVVVVDPAVHGKKVAYSGRFDGDSRSLKVKVNVPDEKDAKIEMDMFYFIETETNFDSKEAEIKVVTDYDIGTVLLDGNAVEELRTVSGDKNYDTIAEENTACEAARVLELRTKRNSEAGLTEEEKKEFAEKRGVCSAPVWVKKSYDAKALRGKTVEVEVRYTTDAGYNEVGIVVDNITAGSQKIDFETATVLDGRFKLITDGKDYNQFQQYYLFEYRDPSKKFEDESGRVASLNMDSHIRSGGQSYILDGEGSLVDRFRMVKMNFQPGVLVWYFNSKYTRTQNNADLQEGKGYLLVVNSQPGEMKLPGTFSDAKWFGADGQYRVNDQDFKDYLAQQRADFVCLSHTAYATYVTGEAPACDASTKDALQAVTLNGKPLRYRREWFNEILPVSRYDFEDLGDPFRSDSGIRTALSTFRPKGAAAFRPFTVYKIDDGKMVVDADATEQALAVEAVDGFSDAAQTAPAKRFAGDTVLVEKKGFEFKVVEPSERVKAQYAQGADANENAFIHRKPLAKVYLNWK